MDKYLNDNLTSEQNLCKHSFVVIVLFKMSKQMAHCKSLSSSLGWQADHKMLYIQMLSKIKQYTYFSITRKKRVWLALLLIWCKFPAVWHFNLKFTIFREWYAVQKLPMEKKIAVGLGNGLTNQTDLFEVNLFHTSNCI